MKKHKSPSDLNTRLLRANVDTYLIVKGLSRQLDIPMADALDKLITGQLKPKPELKPEPAVQVTGIPAPAFRNAPVTAIATNGSKGTAFRIKLKGARYD